MNKAITGKIMDLVVVIIGIVVLGAVLMYTLPYAKELVAQWMGISLKTRLSEAVECSYRRCVFGCSAVAHIWDKIGTCPCVLVPSEFKEDYNPDDASSGRLCAHGASQYPVEVPGKDELSKDALRFMEIDCIIPTDAKLSRSGTIWGYLFGIAGWPEVVLRWLIVDHTIVGKRETESCNLGGLDLNVENALKKFSTNARRLYVYTVRGGITDSSKTFIDGSPSYVILKPDLTYYVEAETSNKYRIVVKNDAGGIIEDDIIDIAYQFAGCGIDYAAKIRFYCDGRWEGPRNMCSGNEETFCNNYRITMIRAGSGGGKFEFDIIYSEDLVDLGYENVIANPTFDHGGGGWSGECNDNGVSDPDCTRDRDRLYAGIGSGDITITDSNIGQTKAYFESDAWGDRSRSAQIVQYGLDVPTWLIPEGVGSFKIDLYPKVFTYGTGLWGESGNNRNIEVKFVNENGKVLIYTLKDRTDTDTEKHIKKSLPNGENAWNPWAFDLHQDWIDKFPGYPGRIVQINLVAEGYDSGILRDGYDIWWDNAVLRYTPPSISLSAEPSAITTSSSSTITATIGDVTALGRSISFSTDLGTVSPTSCYTYVSNSCSVTFTSSSTGTANIFASLMRCSDITNDAKCGTQGCTWGGGACSGTPSPNYLSGSTNVIVS